MQHGPGWPHTQHSRLAAEELPVLIARGIELFTLKAEQEKIKKVLRDKLHVEI